jgi:hypothetical protein
MSEKYDHEIPHHDPQEGFDATEPAAPQITFFVVASVITLVVMIGAIQFYFDGVWDTMVYDQVLTVPGQELGQLRNLEAWRLTHYEYATPDQTTVRIPFERAKQLFLEEYSQGRTFYPGLSTEPKPEEPAAPAEGAPDAKGPPDAKGEESKQ